MYAISLRICSFACNHLFKGDGHREDVDEFPGLPYGQADIQSDCFILWVLTPAKVIITPPAHAHQTSYHPKEWLRYVSTTQQTIVSTRFVLRMGMVCILYTLERLPQNEQIGLGINLWFWNGKGSSFKSGSVRVRFAGIEKVEQGRLNKRFVGLETLNGLQKIPLHLAQC